MDEILAEDGGSLMKTSMMMRVTCIVVLTAGMHAQVSQAAIINQLDSQGFDYKYEMTVQPNNQDLDGNAFDDWWDAGVPTVSGGFAANTAVDQIFRGDFTNSVWRGIANTAAADWTFEIRVAKTGGTQGTNGWFGIAQANLGESNSSVLWIKDDRVVFNASEYFVGTTFGDGTYNVFRIAHDAADNQLYAWVNGTLVNADLSTPIGGSNGSSFDNSTYIGDYSPSGFAGNYSIDYMRLHSSAVAPVPEPSLVAGAMVASGLGLAIVRRRRWIV